MKTEHTPGPWTFDNGKTYGNTTDRAFEVGTKDRIIATIHGSAFEHTTVALNEAEANAKLIAAAPDLLMALKMMERFVGGPRIPKYLQDPYRMAVGAIKKATI